MESSNDNVRNDLHGEDIVVLGSASVETKGGVGDATESLGRILLPGIEDE